MLVLVLVLVRPWPQLQPSRAQTASARAPAHPPHAGATSAPTPRRCDFSPKTYSFDDAACPIDAETGRAEASCREEDMELEHFDEGVKHDVSTNPNLNPNPNANPDPNPNPNPNPDANPNPNRNQVDSGMIDMIKQAYETVARRGLKLSLFASPWSALALGFGCGSGSGLGGRIPTLTSI